MRRKPSFLVSYCTKSRLIWRHDERDLYRDGDLFILCADSPEGVEARIVSEAEARRIMDAARPTESRAERKEDF